MKNENLRSLLQLAETIFLLSALLVISVFTIFDDDLFFHSDLNSMFRFTCSVALIVGLVLFVAALPIYFYTKKQRQFLEIPALLAMAVIVSDAVFFMVSAVLDWLYHGHQLLNTNSARIGLILFWIALISAALIRSARSKSRDNLAKETNQLARWFARAGIFLLVFLSCIERVAQPEPVSKPKRVVLIVLDGWPTEYIHTFNPLAQKKKIDDFLENAYVFRNVHTVHPYTYGFFLSLYRASAGVPYRINSRFGPEEWNLFSSLQSAGVNTRWLTFHRIGIPDVKGITNYKGFRSAFLSQQYDPFLNALGLSFNSILPTTANDSLLENQSRMLLFRTLNTYKDYNDPLQEVLLKELRFMHEKSQPTFLIFHDLWQMGKYSLPPLWAKWTAGAKKESLLKKIKSRDNRYTEAEAWFAKETTVENNGIIDTVSEKLMRFVSEARKEHLLDNTLLIITADHGTMSSYGRYWYGFHPDEQATRVPVIFIQSKQRGTDERPFDTYDLCRTIVEYFGQRNFPNPRTVSLLSGGEKPYTGTLTLRSDINKEWFLVIHKSNVSYRFNLHPQSAGTAEKFLVDHFQSTRVQEGPGLISETQEEIKELFREYRVNRNKINSAYRPYAPYAW